LRPHLPEAEYNRKNRYGDDSQRRLDTNLGYRDVRITTRLPLGIRYNFALAKVRRLSNLPGWKELDKSTSFNDGDF
jgi:hypothetical protein